VNVANRAWIGCVAAHRKIPDAPGRVRLWTFAQMPRRSSSEKPPVLGVAIIGAGDIARCVRHVLAVITVHAENSKLLSSKAAEIKRIRIGQHEHVRNRRVMSSNGGEGTVGKGRRRSGHGVD